MRLRTIVVASLLKVPIQEVRGAGLSFDIGVVALHRFVSSACSALTPSRYISRRLRASVRSINHALRILGSCILCASNTAV
jgi:hypothetical protein